MTDKERILAEIEALQSSIMDEHTNLYSQEAQGEFNALTKLEVFINSMDEEPVSEDLEDTTQTIAYDGKVYTRRYKDKLDTFACKYPMSVPKPSKMYAKYSDVDLTIAVKEGAKWQKEQIMKDSTNVTVHIDAGGYPYIPQMELYDYDKDMPLAKKGDKVKVIVIKEN